MAKELRITFVAEGISARVELLNRVAFQPDFATKLRRRMTIFATVIALLYVAATTFLLLG